MSNSAFSQALLVVPVTIANGGTNATSAANARTNLLPSQGSSSGKFLTTNGTDVSWGIPAVVYSVTTQTGATLNDATTSGEEVILCDATSNAITVNLATAISNTATLHIKKTDSSANAVTIDAFSTQTIDGSLTAVISVQNVCITIVSNGSNWYII